MNHTKEPWRHVFGHDTHKIKRDDKGAIIGPVTMPFDDYWRACECVNACAGINPEPLLGLLWAVHRLTTAADAGRVVAQSPAEAQILTDLRSILSTMTNPEELKAPEPAKRPIAQLRTDA